MEQCCINVDNVESTLHQCCISTLIQHNHMTLNQRCFNVDSTPCAHWVTLDAMPKEGSSIDDVMLKGQWKVCVCGGGGGEDVNERELEKKNTIYF